MGLQLNQRELSKAIGVHPETLSRWRKAGMPCVEKGVGHGGAVVYDLADIIQWVLNTDKRRENGELSPAVESAKLSKARRLKVDLDRRLKAAELVSAKGVVQAIFPMYHVVRDAILAIPDRVAPELAKITDEPAMHARLTAEVRTTLEAAIAKVIGVAKKMGNSPSSAMEDDGTGI